jgi:membrane-associated protein
VARSRLYFKKRGGWAVFFSRFLVAALGGIVNLLAGAELYPYPSFLFCDIAGEALGALIPLLLGFAFGASWDAIGDILGTSSLLVLGLLVVIYLSIRLLRYVRRVQKARAAAAYKAPLMEAPLKSPEAPEGSV